MQTATITYALKWQIKGMLQYKVTACGKVFNTRNNRLLKRCYNGGSVGYWLQGKFYTLAKIRKKLELIPREIFCPF